MTELILPSGWGRGRGINLCCPSKLNRVDGFWLRRLTAAALTLSALLLLGCDPGIAIHQVNAMSKRAPQVAVPQRVSLQVSTFRTLAYSGFYAARMKITNSFGTELTVYKVELIAREAVYEPKGPSSLRYPVVVGPGVEANLEAWFDLKESLHATFTKPAELRVYYKSAEHDETASAMLESGLR